MKDGRTVIVGADGVASGPLGFVTVAWLLTSAPGLTLSTVTSKITVRVLLAGMVMPVTVRMPLLLLPPGAGVNALVAPAGIDTTLENVVLAGMWSVTDTPALGNPADSISVTV